jgi:hypothetical protein
MAQAVGNRHIMPEALGSNSSTTKPKKEKYVGILNFGLRNNLLNKMQKISKATKKRLRYIKI